MRNGGCCTGTNRRTGLHARHAALSFLSRPLAWATCRALAARASSHDAPSAARRRRRTGDTRRCRRCALWGPSRCPAPARRRDDHAGRRAAGRPGGPPGIAVRRRGRALDRALGEAGIERAHCYLTNAVKHFKWEPRGKRRPRNARWPRAATGSNANSMRYGRASSSRSAAPRCARCCKTTMRRSRRARADSHGARPARRRHLSPVVRAAHARRRFARACVPEARRRVAHRIAPTGEPDRDGDLDRDNRHGARGGTR